ncbi:hypothetical protein [Glutamicibacter sp. NPDC087344]|uniref:hypothetical protein n=1 Tax=Glutamicibacter sp. NPDC087344 TaxID=3363994 RepID=UPI00381B1D8F
MEPQLQGPYVPPEMLSKRPKKSWIIPASAGLAAGTVLGLLIGVTASGGGVSSSAMSQKVIDQAVENCSMDAEGYTVMDGGAAIELDTKGEDSFDSGTSNYFSYLCMLDELGVPEVTQQKMSRTRALDGTQRDTWDGLQASWSYHPDSGINILIEGAKN